MKQSIDFNDFERAFSDYNRSENFSSSGLEALFNYLEEYEEDTGQEMELDVIALCCDFTEENYNNVRSNYSLDDDQDVLEYLNNRTFVVWHDDNTVLYQQF